MRRRTDKAGLDPVRLATDMEVAWAAGVYEGEGSCVRSGHGLRSFVCSMGQKDPEVLYRLRDLFGGRVIEFDNNRGTLASKSKPFTIFIWQVCGDRARVFLSAIYPFLTARRRAQIDSTRVVEFREFVGELPGANVIPYLHSKVEQWIEIHRQDSRKRRLESYRRFDAKRNGTEERVAWRRENRRINRERNGLDAKSKEGI